MKIIFLIFKWLYVYQYQSRITLQFIYKLIIKKIKSTQLMSDIRNFNLDQSKWKNKIYFGWPCTTYFQHTRVTETICSRFQEDLLPTKKCWKRPLFVAKALGKVPTKIQSGTKGRVSERSAHFSQQGQHLHQYIHERINFKKLFFVASLRILLYNSIWVLFSIQNQ